MAEEKKYDLFVSYSSVVDYILSRNVESFLESFHNLISNKQFPLKPLQVCRDGSDFELHKIITEANSKINREEFIKLALIEYLKQCDKLIILCSSGSTKSKYVDFEIKWFLENRSREKIFLAITDGEDIKAATNELFPEVIVSNNLPIEFAFDFRGFKKESKNWIAVKDFDDEIVNLASQLNGVSRGELIPIWLSENQKKLKEERRKLIKQRLVLAIAAIVSIILFAVAFIQKLIANDARDYAKQQKEVAIKAQKEAENNLRNYEYKKLSELIADAESYNKAGGVLGIEKKKEAIYSANRILEKYEKDSLFSAEAIKIHNLNK